MANSNRRYMDGNGNQFMPMNVEGGTWDEHFISTKKLVVLGAVFFSLLFIIMYLLDAGSGPMSYIIFIAIWFMLSQWAVRFIVFEEKFYYKMYKVLRDHEISTPAIFWDIASIKDTSDGAILTYSDTKIGILVKIERDTITGKHPDFKEVHFDAISDFYKALVSMRYQFIQFNIMEKAGNDPRLEYLDQLVHKSDNNNICKLMEREIGYIKSITHKTLYESDYILVYTSDLTKMDTIINDTIDCIYKILDGAYIGYRILSSREIIEFVKEQYGVKYFNYTQATLDMRNMYGNNIEEPFIICGVEYTNGKIQEVEKDDLVKIKRMTSDILSGARPIDSLSIQNTLNKNKRKEFNGVDFENISTGFKAPPQSQNKGKGIPKFNPKKPPVKSSDKAPPVKPNANINNNSLFDDMDDFDIDF